MVEPISAALAGIALVKKSVDFIKTNITAVQDIGDVISHVDNALNGQQQVIKEREKKGADPFAVENVAKEVIDAKLAQEALYEMKQLINARFGHGTWEYILEERKKRIDKKKQAVKEARAAKLKKQKEMYEMVRMVSIGIAILLFVVVAIGITIKFVLAHPVEGDDKSCKLYQPKYYLICLSEGRGYADTQLYLDYKRMRDNWIVDDDKK